MRFVGPVNSARDPLMCLLCCEQSQVEKSKIMVEKKKEKKETNAGKIIRIQTTPKALTLFKPYESFVKKKRLEFKSINHPLRQHTHIVF